MPMSTQSLRLRGALRQPSVGSSRRQHMRPREPALSTPGSAILPLRMIQIWEPMQRSMSSVGMRWLGLAAPPGPLGFAAAALIVVGAPLLPPPPRSPRSWVPLPCWRGGARRAAYRMVQLAH